MDGSLIASLGLFLFSLLGLSLVYAVKMMCFLKFVVMCKEANIGLDNFMYAGNTKVLSQAQRVLKYDDMQKGFGILTVLSILVSIVYGIRFIVVS